jgi:hypothetical protein
MSSNRYKNLYIKPASKHCNDVILSDAKNLAFSCCYEILHSVQDDDNYNCRVNNSNDIFYKIPPNLPLPKGGKIPLYQEGIKGCVPLFGKEGIGEIFQINTSAPGY